MFNVELAGCGIVRDPQYAPYPVFIMSVQQPMQTWTCYRRYSSFRSLAEHLGITRPGSAPLPQCPLLSEEALLASAEQLQKGGGALLQWLHQVLQQPGVKESQAMTNFLCANANLAPPRLEVTWARNYSPSLDEMEMDDLFDPSLEDRLEGVNSTSVSRDAGGGGSDYESDGDEPPPARSYGGYSYGGHSEMDFGTPNAFAAGGAQQQQQHGNAGAYDQYLDPQLDMPSEDDIASSMPVEITFMQPRAGNNFNNDFNNNFNNGIAATLSKLDTPANPGQAPPIEAPPSSGPNTFSVSSTSSDGGDTLAALQEQNHLNFNSAEAIVQAELKYKPNVGLDNFRIIKVIGKGSFGKVFLVRDKLGGQIYAMKVLRKDNIIKRNQVEHTKTERNVLGYIRHPFIVGLNMAFQTRDKLFFVLDYCAGGELFFHLGKLGKFPEPRSKFYAAEIALALEHVHKLGIVYRDLKPENVLLDGEGHIRLTDFGLSKEGITNNTSGAHSFCGTPEYLAPEILNRQGHGRAVDWWSLGALLYEMLTGLPPFYCRDREKLFDKIRRAQLTYPRYLSEAARDILHGLLTRDPSLRLGSSSEDAGEIKRHMFFGAIDWDRMLRRELRSPWQPSVVGSVDTSQFDLEFTSMPIFSPGDRELKSGTLAGHMQDRGAAALPGSSTTDKTFEGFTFVDRSSVLHANHAPQHQVP
eukprot:TRINITY_DN822_c0_g1_i1.p1 TRINITY_DN822_c0_g1~~TRINITY_DN822_c0_g1_i1.p1  ORF type:complete len:695 (-),score=249.47 TRINITY_DN822_c0_g1_i1:1021-3105(-)